LSDEEIVKLGCFLELLSPACLIIIAYLLYRIADHMGALTP
jgi:hypothetical protein